MLRRQEEGFFALGGSRVGIWLFFQQTAISHSDGNIWCLFLIRCQEINLKLILLTSLLQSQIRYEDNRNNHNKDYVFSRDEVVGI